MTANRNAEDSKCRRYEGATCCKVRCPVPAAVWRVPAGIVRHLAASWQLVEGPERCSRVRHVNNNGCLGGERTMLEDSVGT